VDQESALRKNSRLSRMDLGIDMYIIIVQVELIVGAKNCTYARKIY
jgi:hypothetical protein